LAIAATAELLVIGRIHGAIVAASGRSDRRGDCRGDRSDGRRRSPRVYAYLRHFANHAYAVPI